MIFKNWFHLSPYTTYALDTLGEIQGFGIGKGSVLLVTREYSGFRDYSVTILVTTEEGDINIRSSGMGNALHLTPM